jgi:toxin ParE1/3/4
LSQVHYSQAAISDIDKIWDYTFERYGVEQAERYTREFHKTCKDLASGRKAGRPVFERDGYLRYATARHVVFFRERSDGIFVVRILHERLDLARHLE